MKQLALALMTFVSFISASEAAISISCGRSVDFNEETYSYSPEIFAIGAPDDDFIGPIGIKWDASVNGLNVREKGSKKVNLIAERDNNDFLEKIVLTYARTNKNGKVSGRQYVVVNPYADEPTLEVYYLYFNSDRVLKGTYSCTSSMD